MALVLKDRVKETTTTTGTGSLTLGGAVTGYQSFGSAIGNGNTTYYAIYLDGGSEWEVGLGTVGSGTLARTTVYASSNGGSLVDFSAGQKSVWGDYPATKAVYLDASGNVSETIGNISAITGGISSPDFIQFDVNPSTTPTTPGALYWDNADGNQTLSLVMANGDAVQQIGEEQYYRIKASSAITNGQVVMFTGSVGASGALTGAPASGLTASTASYIMGIATQDIALNGWGYVTSFGLVRGLNTSAYTDGAILYYDPTVAGGLTATVPSAPNAKIQVCAVTHAASNGSLFVRPTFGGILGQYEGDVGLSAYANGQTLIRDESSGKWVNATLTGGTGVSVTNGAGSITITNTAPDQTVSISGGTGISTSGTYPNFTIASTVQGLPSQTGNTGKYLTTDGSSASWGALPTYIPVTNRATSVIQVSVAYGYMPILTRGGTTTNVPTY